MQKNLELTGVISTQPFRLAAPSPVHSARVLRSALTRPRLVVLLWLLTTLLAYSQDSPRPSSAKQDSVLPAVALKIILLRPLIRYEDVRTGASAGGGGARDADYEGRLLDAAKKAVGAKVVVLEMDRLDSPVDEVCRRLQTIASRLARGALNDDANDDLARLAGLNASYAILAQSLRLNTGPGSSWNSYSGAITSSTASTLVQAALVSAKTGRVLWKGERLVRNKALKAADAEFSKTLALLYKDFEIN